MSRIVRRIINEFNIKKEAEELGVSVWQTPSVLFILMGIVIIIAMTSIFYISRNHFSSETLVLSEALMISLIFSIGGFIIKSIEEVAKANKMKSEFISIASHQMKTPLTEVSWEIEYLLSEYKDKLDDGQLKIIKTITQSNAKMSNLVNDLLDVVRIEQGKMVLAEDKVDISRIINEVINDKKLITESNNIGIEIEIADSIPEIISDRRRIKVAVNSLIDNAIKYIDKKGAIKVSVEKENDSVIVRVQDNGIGIPAKQQDIIFEKFFRSDNAARYQTEGIGLGLYMAKKIIEQAGGKIWFKSTEGEGSIFAFSLPINNN